MITINLNNSKAKKKKLNKQNLKKKHQKSRNKRKNIHRTEDKQTSQVITRSHKEIHQHTEKMAINNNIKDKKTTTTTIKNMFCNIKHVRYQTKASLIITRNKNERNQHTK